EAPAPPSSEQPKTGCGRPISAPYTQAEFDADESEGIFLISGEIFGKQIRLRDLAVSRQTNKVVHGKVQLHQLDVGALGALTLGAVAHNILPTGTVSGELEMRRLLVDDLYASDASLKLTEARLSLEQLRVQLASPETRIRLAGGLIKTEGLALEAISETGRSGIVDA